MQINSNSSKEIKINNNLNNHFKKEMHTLYLKSWDDSWDLQFCLFPEPREKKRKTNIQRVLASIPPPKSL